MSQALPFRVHNDGTVTDLRTGLMWQQYGSRVRYSWQDAGLYCDQARTAGYLDWRLPTLRELVGLVVSSRSRPAIAPVFQCQEDGRYWSQTTKVNNEDKAGGVHFLAGTDFWEQKQSRLYVRCVRDPEQ